jgi:hypothetical protein
MMYFYEADSSENVGCTISAGCQAQAGNPPAMQADYIGAWSATASDGTPVETGYAMDTDNWDTITSGGNTYNPGTNVTSQAVTVNDQNYAPTGGSLTTAARGMRGGVLADGTLLFPFNADGVPKSSGLVGAMP